LSREEGALRVLIVEDDEAIAGAMKLALEQDGREVVLAADAEAGLARVTEGFHLVVADYKMPGMNGVELIHALAEKRVAAPVLMVSGSADIGKAVDAMKAGAFDFLEKPLSMELFRVRVTRALEVGRTAEELQELRRRVTRRRKADLVIGVSAAIEEVRRLIGAVAKTEVAVSVTGETGTGKELAARTIHDQSNRSDRPFVVVDCAALPEPLLENELFGHEAGAYTGADRRAAGLLAEAAGGTVFIDEVGEMPLTVQSKLLRFLQTKEFRRVGASQVTHVDVRVVCATNRDLAAEVRAKRFRADLFYRINVFPLRVPPLRERPVDVPLLADHFLKAGAREANRALEGFAPEANEVLAAYGWPGNVRELENLVRRLAVLAAGPRISATDCRMALEPVTRSAEAMPAAAVPAGGAGARPYREARAEVLDGFERSYFGELIAVARGNLTVVARLAGLDRKNLWLKLKKHGLGRDAGERGENAAHGAVKSRLGNKS
jgi:DNA-binding NtrC family response regulator